MWKELLFSGLLAVVIAYIVGSVCIYLDEFWQRMGDHWRSKGTLVDWVREEED